jgi:predicted ester cyclase
MSTEENKAIVRRLTEEVWVKGNLAVADELVSPDFVFHDPYGETRGIDGFKQMVKATHAAFSDLQATIEDQIAEGDKVATRFTQRCTHTGELVWWGLAPTGKQVTITGTVTNRIEDGKIVERWVDLDLLGMMQQLGVVPALGGT